MSMPVEAATAFANLYQRWFDDARGLAEANRRQARGAVGARVADVVTLWNERERSWLPNAPTILRLESGDLAAFAMREPCIALYSGCIATDAPVTGLRWESFRPCSYAIGRTVADLVLVTGRGGLLEDVEVVLDDGGRLLLGNRDAWPLAHAV